MSLYNHAFFFFLPLFPSLFRVRKVVRQSEARLLREKPSNLTGKRCFGCCRSLLPEREHTRGAAVGAAEWKTGVKKQRPIKKKAQTSGDEEGENSELTAG